MRDLGTTQRRRRENLRVLIEKHSDSAKQLAERLSWSQSRLSHLKGDKAMGEATAREIEKVLGLAPGWMDADHAPDTDPIEDELLAQVFEAVLKSVGKGRQLSNSKFANLATIVYLAAKQSGGIDAANVERLLQLTDSEDDLKC